jgi:hypothetical protein
MRLNLFNGFDIDAAREANPRLRFRKNRGGTVTITPACPCPDCGEPMADGGHVGYYCTAKGCDHDKIVNWRDVRP